MSVLLHQSVVTDIFTLLYFQGDAGPPGPPGPVSTITYRTEYRSLPINN